MWRNVHEDDLQLIARHSALFTLMTSPVALGLHILQARMWLNQGPGDLGSLAIMPLAIVSAVIYFFIAAGLFLIGEKFGARFDIGLGTSLVLLFFIAQMVLYTSNIVSIFGHMQPLVS